MNRAKLRVNANEQELSGLQFPIEVQLENQASKMSAMQIILPSETNPNGNTSDEE